MLFAVQAQFAALQMFPQVTGKQAPQGKQVAALA
jgi:hypothetical protein